MSVGERAATAPRGYREAVQRLASAQKSGAGVPAYLRYVNRGWGRRCAAIAYVLRMTPDQVTMLSGLCSLAGVAILAWRGDEVVFSLIGVFLLLFGYALDSADGQLARLQGGGSKAGEFLDHVADAFRLPLVHLGAALLLFSHPDRTQDWPMAMALGFMVVASGWFFGQILADTMLPKDNRPGVNAPVWVSFAKLPYDVGFLYLSFLLAPWLPAFLAVYGGLFLLTLGVATMSLRNKYRAVRALA